MLSQNENGLGKLFKGTALWEIVLFVPIVFLFIYLPDDRGIYIVLI